MSIQVKRLRKSIKVLERAIALNPGEFLAPFRDEHRRQKEQLERVMRCNLDELKYRKVSHLTDIRENSRKE